MEYLEGSDKIILEVAENFENIHNIMSGYVQKDRLPEEKILQVYTSTRNQR